MPLELLLHPQICFNYLAWALEKIDWTEPKGDLVWRGSSSKPSSHRKAAEPTDFMRLVGKDWFSIFLLKLGSKNSHEWKILSFRESECSRVHGFVAWGQRTALAGQWCWDPCAEYPGHISFSAWDWVDHGSLHFLLASSDFSLLSYWNFWIIF